jgi:hypothetical protein
MGYIIGQLQLELVVPISPHPSLVKDEDSFAMWPAAETVHVELQKELRQGVDVLAGPFGSC